MCCADRTGDLTDFCLQGCSVLGWPVTSTTLLAIAAALPKTQHFSFFLLSDSCLTLDLALPNADQQSPFKSVIHPEFFQLLSPNADPCR